MTHTNKNKKPDDNNTILKSQYDKLRETDPILWMMCENIRTMPPLPPVGTPFRATDFSSRNNNKFL
jgi:hypothetical protein